MGNPFGRSIIVPLTNQSGGSVAAGDVVVVDTAHSDSFTTDTSGGFTGGVGIAQATIGSGSIGLVLTQGYASLVNVNASVTRGHFGKTYTVAKQATDAGASRGAGTFCQFLTGGTTPDALVYPVDLLGSSLTNPMSGVGDLIQGTTAGAPAALAAVATGKVLVSQGVTTANAWGYPPFHGCRVIDTSGQTIANNSLTAVALAGTEEYDTDAYHDTVTNNSRITIPTGLGGKYRLGGTVALATSSTTGARLLAVRLNGSTYIALTEYPGIGSSEQYISIATEYVLAAADYVELVYRQTTGGSLGLVINASYGCQFWASLVGV